MSNADTLEFRILGPIEIVRDGMVTPLGASKPAQLLAVLLLNQNEPIDSDVLIDELWGESPPPTARKSLQTHIWNLRQLIERDEGPPVLVTHGSSYGLHLSPEQVDAHRFDELVRDGRAALGAGDQLTGRDLLEKALGLWRGPPLADFRYSEFAQAEIRRLEDLRLQVFEERAQADLALGRHTELVGELRKALREGPTRERLWELLALALCRSGRFAEAVQVCREAASVLHEELGVDPGPWLTELMDRIDRRDPMLAWSPPDLPGSASDQRLAMSRPVVGRGREMGRLSSILDEVYEGQGWVVTVSGGAGMGKTRLIRELEPYAAMRGARVLWGRPQRDAGSAAYWPMIEILTAHLSSVDARQAEKLGPQPNALVELIPEAGRRLGTLDQEPPHGFDHQENRLLMFGAITNYLIKASELEPLVVVVDDMHWADESTLLLVRHLAPRLGDARILLIVALRDTDPSRESLTETLEELSRALRHQSLPLESLTRDHVAEYLAATVGDDPPADPEVVHHATGGNPFFLVELTSLLGQHPGAGGSGDIPSSLSTVIRRRIGSLSQGSRRALEAGSVSGPDLDPLLMASVIGEQQDHTVELLDEAVSAGILEHHAEGYSFAHDLIREAIIDDLSVGERNRYHAEIADRLEDLAGVEPGRVAARLAFHYTRSGQPPHLKRAVGYETLAGDQARQVSAWEKAATHYERALRLLERLGLETTQRAADLHLRLSTCRRLSGEIVDAGDRLFAAFETYRRAGDGAGLARVVIEGLSDELFIGAERAIALTDEALSANRGASPQLRARLLARRAWEPLGFDDASNQAAREAIDLAVSHGLADIEAIMQDRETHRVIHAGHFTEARSLARSGHRAAHKVGNSELATHSLAEIMGTHIMEGNFDAGLHAAHHAIEYSDEHRSLFWGQVARFVAARVHVLRAERDAMEELIADVPDQTFLSPLLVRAAWAEMTGDLDAADDFAALATESLPLHRMAGFVRGIYHGLRARIATRRHDQSTARHAFAGWREAIAESFGGYRTAAVGEIGIALTALGDPELLEQVYDELVSIDSRATFPAWPLDPLRGEIALKLGRSDAAERHFRTGYEWATSERLATESIRAP